MPSKDLHRQVSQLILQRDGALVQQILDSTSQKHAGRHREDPIHSIEGLAIELASRGELTADRIVDGALHLVVDEVWSRAMRAIPVRGPMRQPTKQFLEAGMTELARAALRRRRR
jgi:hypothetical protein